MICGNIIKSASNILIPEQITSGEMAVGTRDAVDSEDRRILICVSNAHNKLQSKMLTYQVLIALPDKVAEMKGESSVCLFCPFIYPSVCLAVYLFISLRLSVCLSPLLSIYLSLCVSQSACHIVCLGNCMTQWMSFVPAWVCFSAPHYSNRIASIVIFIQRTMSVKSRSMQTTWQVSALSELRLGVSSYCCTTQRSFLINFRADTWHMWLPIAQRCFD